MARKIENFVPARLDQALAARGFSAVELAARVGVTSTTISRWRNEAQQPSGELLFKMADALRVTPQWLTRPLPSPLSRPNFRGSVAQMKADRALLASRTAWLAELAASFEEYVDYPDVNLPTFGFSKATEISDEDIEDAAIACRELWGLKDGPVSDVVLLLENAGVIVAREETGTARIEGLSAWTAEGRPVVLLCADKGNGFRGRFDAAHELGHLVLHRFVPGAPDAATHKLMELQAHRFAGAFLLPAKAFAAELPMPVSLQGLLMLKPRWGVSVAAMIMRLRALKVLDDADYMRLIKLRSAKWGNKAEPLDGERQPEQPRLLGRTAKLLHEAGVVTHESLSDFIGLSNRDIESLLGLPFGYLSPEKADVVALQPKLSVRPALGEGVRDNVVSFPGRRSEEKK